MHYDDLHDKQWNCDTTGGAITFDFIADLLNGVKWTPDSCKVILMDCELWDTLYLRLCDSGKEVFRCRPGKRLRGEVEEVDFYIIGENFYFTMPNPHNGQLLADEGACPDGSLWIIDYSFAPWSCAVAWNLTV